MRFIILSLLLCSVIYGQEVDPGDALDEARTFVREKRYEEALHKYKWFFENSVQIDEAYFGVKHSYCLTEWWSLGEIFPEAKKVYLQEVAIRSNKLKNDEYSWDLFYEYMSMSEYAGSEKDVIEMFRGWSANEQFRVRADGVFHGIRDLLFERQEYELIDTHTKDYGKWYKELEAMPFT